MPWRSAQHTLLMNPFSTVGVDVAIHLLSGSEFRVICSASRVERSVLGSCHWIIDIMQSRVCLKPVWSSVGGMGWVIGPNHFS